MVIEYNDFKKMLESIRSKYGYDFTEYSEASVKRRSVSFMTERKIGSMESLGKMLINDESLFEEFVRNISVTVTEMFRDPQFYKSLRENAMKRLATYPFIKIWIAGCATGEEAYSLAILLREEGILDRSIIYATDINQYSLQVAREGIFPMDSMKTFTSNYLKSGGKNSFSNYYRANYHAALFDKSLRQNIVFSYHNLTCDKSFNEFQLILCRNVLIYFNQVLQNKAINLFYESLAPFGILGLGNKESLLFTDRKKCFSDIDKKERIFMKNG